MKLEEYDEIPTPRVYSHRPTSQIDSEYFSEYAKPFVSISSGCCNL